MFRGWQSETSDQSRARYVGPSTHKLVPKWSGALLGPLPGPRQQRRLDPVPHLQLLQDVGHVVLDRLLAELQLRADLLVAVAARHPLQDLALALGQVI